MAQALAEKLESLLRGELSATETYQQALDKLGDTKGAPELRRIHGEHREAADALRQHMREHGFEPAHKSGVWGTFAKAVEGTAKLFGNDAALKALKEGEEHGIKEYEKALHDRSFPADCGTLVSTNLLAKARTHVPVLDRLMAGLVERIAPEEARLRLNAGGLLVCSYDDAKKFRDNHLVGAISLQEFESRSDTIPKDREIIFYCA